MTGNDLEKIREARQRWEETTVKKSLQRFGLQESPNTFFTPADLGEFDFLLEVGFPGEYPFTAGTYAVMPYAAGEKGSGFIAQAPGLTRAGRYSGYGAPEDTRDYYLQMQSLGQTGGPNLAFDLPTQCGYDSNNPLARGEVGKVGVAVDTLLDLEIIYEAFQGPNDLDKIASNFTINAPANIIIAMYLALAEKRGLPWDKLRGTPQNDILKEYVARGMYIFPPGPALKLFQDSVEFLTRYVPQMNITSIGGYHIRGAGATREQDLAFSMAFGVTYLEAGRKTGLDVDAFAPRFTFNAFGGSMEFFKEIAFQRAARRMWARLLKERFGAKDPRSMMIRQPGGAHMGYENCTVQRPLNNLTRSVVGAIASALSGGPCNVSPPYDEPLGLGWSLEACQLAEDAGRILQYEARLNDVLDPLAGSYYVEKLTNDIEETAWQELEKIEAMGGAIAAIESGYLQREIAKSAYERQRRIESGEAKVVGVNCFTGPHELEVSTNRLVSHPYDPARREAAEQRQLARLARVKKERDGREVVRSLRELEQAAQDGSKNLFPFFLDCVKVYATLQEICDVLRQVYGEYSQPGLL